MIKIINHTSYEMAKKIIEVQRPSYKIEAEIIDFEGIPALNETEKEIMKSKEAFIGYYVEEKLVAFISYEQNKNEIDICKLVVHPASFRRGIAKKLLQFVLNEKKKEQKVVVSTGSKNIPALALYKSFGFSEVQKIEVAPNFFITQLHKEC